MFLIRLILLPIRVAFATTRTGTKIGYRVGRAVGYRRVVLVAAGVAVGLMIAPTSGRELRRRLQVALQGEDTHGLDHDAGLAEQVRFHLRQAPRTWHLPQPVVTEVSPGAIRLDGAVADDTARRDLAAVTAQVEGVASVDNQVRVG